VLAYFSSGLPISLNFPFICVRNFFCLLVLPFASLTWMTFPPQLLHIGEGLLYCKGLGMYCVDSYIYARHLSKGILRARIAKHLITENNAQMCKLWCRGLKPGHQNWKCTRDMVR
jgi:hypothetical protein